MIARFGITGSYALAYFVTADYFPTKYCSLVFGFCNLLARIVTIFSSMIAEMDEPYPMIIFTVFCAASCFASMFLAKDKERIFRKTK
jgi:hypothetical protein